MLVVFGKDIKLNIKKGEISNFYYHLSFNLFVLL